MGQLSYSALDMAVILCKKNLGIREECQFLLDFWRSERRFLEWKYQSNKRRFLQDTQYWMHYLNDKEQLDYDFADIVKAAENNGTQIEVEDYWRDLDEVDIVFKEMYLDMAFFRKTKYVRKSMRQMLAKYHLKRRTASIVEKMERYVRFYEMEMLVNRKRISDLSSIPLDQLITFRLCSVGLQSIRSKAAFPLLHWTGYTILPINNLASTPYCIPNKSTHKSP